MRISLIGFGTVGQGVAMLLQKHRELYASRVGETLELSSVLVRDASKKRDIELPSGVALTDDVDAFWDIDADLVVEVAGGVEAGFETAMRSLERGSDLVTANKAMIAAKGSEVYAKAESLGRRIGIEATVAGGVPILNMITTAMAANQIDSITGITNGTCHYIIRAMEQGQTYDEALAKATEIGFAEADPTLDVSGRDSVEKLAIMATLAFGGGVNVDEIRCDGITELTPGIVELAQSLGYSVRLVGYAQRTEKGVGLRNGPMLVPVESTLGRCPAEEMAVEVRADAVSLMTVGGAGAGRFPTASAVVADVIEVARARFAGGSSAGRLNHWPADAPGLVLDDGSTSRYLIDGESDLSEAMRASELPLGKLALPVIE
ncbi:MAG: homoserine dehydrogenase [Planctomycetota bacterium]